jgi:hypothetical protein
VALSTDPSAVALEPFGIAAATGGVRSWLRQARWFGGRQQRVKRIDLEDLAVLRAEAPTVLLTLWRVGYAGGGSEVYSLPLGIRSAPHPLAELGPDHLIATVTSTRGSLIVYDALADPEAAVELWRILAEERPVETAAGRLVSRRLVPVDPEIPDRPRLLDVQQSNSALVRGQLDFLKWSRRIEPGPSVELEMAQALGDRRFPHVPALHGHISYQRAAPSPPSRPCSTPTCRTEPRDGGWR